MSLSMFSWSVKIIFWKSTLQCSAKCNQGTRKRRVHCVDVHNRRHSPRNCRTQFKPEASIPCYIKPCKNHKYALEIIIKTSFSINVFFPGYAHSCKQLKRLARIRKDGDYTLIVKGQPLQVGLAFTFKKEDNISFCNILLCWCCYEIQVYCSQMRKSKPVEYLSLLAGEGENYSEVFDKRYGISFHVCRYFIMGF